MIATAGLLVACGDDDTPAGSDASAATGTPEATGAPTASEVVATTDATAVTDVPAVTDSTSLAALLAAAPAVEATDDLVYVTYGDLDAVSALIGLTRPDGADPDGVIDWAIAISNDDSDDGSQLAVALLPRLVVEGGADSAEMAAELGWQVGDVAAFLEITSGQESVTLVTGDVTEADLDAVAPKDGDTWKVGDGDDFGVNRDAVSPVRPLGQPLHLAWRDGIVVVSRSTPAAEAFATANTSLAESEPRLAAVAAPLAARDVHGAFLATIGVDDPLFDALGVGQAVVDGQRIALFAYHAPDAAGVADLEAVVRDTLTTGSPQRADATWADLFPGAEVIVEGETVLAILPLAPTTPADFAWQMFQIGDGLASATA